MFQMVHPFLRRKTDIWLILSSISFPKQGDANWHRSLRRLNLSDWQHWFHPFTEIASLVPYLCECMCVSSYPISDGTVCHNAYRSTAVYRSELVNESTELMNVWKISHRFHIQNIFLACGCHDGAITKERGWTSSGRHCKRTAVIPMNVHVEHELRVREKWRIPSRIHCTWSSHWSSRWWSRHPHRRRFLLLSWLRIPRQEITDRYNIARRWSISDVQRDSRRFCWSTGQEMDSKLRLCDGRASRQWTKRVRWWTWYESRCSQTSGAMNIYTQREREGL